MDFGTDRSPGNNPHQILRDDCILNQLSQNKGGVKRFLKKKKRIKQPWSKCLCCHPLQIYVEILTPNVMVFRGRASGRQLVTSLN